MKKKLILISIPILISVIGLLSIQAAWMQNIFNNEYQQICDKASIALLRGLENYQKKQEADVTKLLQTKLAGLADTLSVSFVEPYNDSLYIRFNNPTPKGSNSSSYQSVTFNYGRVKLSLPKHYARTYSYLGPNNDAAINRAVMILLWEDEPTAKTTFFKNDSAEIRKYFKKELDGLSGGYLDKIVKFNFAQGDNLATSGKPKTFDTPWVQYRAMGLKNYWGERRFISMSVASFPRLIISKVLFFLMMSCFLTFLLIFSIVYLMKLILRQKQLADMKDDFINNLTHEFKTPIATVSAAVEGLQKFNALDDKDKTNRYLEISRTELNRLNDMVSQVLNISSYEKKDPDLEMQTIDLEAMVNDVVHNETFRGVKPVEFSVNIAPGIKQITADPLHLKNILSNLVDNSVKYSGSSVAINISAYADNGMVHIKIKDNGIGIPASALKYVFDKFYRVTNGNLYNVKGNGLGLSYVKFVVEAHGGTISVKSEINVGTEFLIALPLK